MQKKKGISLIVLVITIIVMIILASAILISLSNSGIIGKANEAVKASDLKAVQNVAALAWAEAYLDKKSAIEIESYVRAELADYGVTDATHIIRFNDNGVEVLEYTLGNLIEGPEDYLQAVKAHEVFRMRAVCIYNENTKDTQICSEINELLVKIRDTIKKAQSLSLGFSKYLFSSSIVITDALFPV